MKKQTSRFTKPAIGLAVFIAALLLPRFLGQYDAHVLMLALVYILLASGLNFTLGFLGQPNFGQATVFGIGAYTSAILTSRFQIPFLLSLLCGLVAGLVAGVVLGYISLQLRGAYFCMVTIAISQAFMLLSQNLIGLTNGPMGITGIVAPNFFGLGKYSLWLVGIALLAAVLLISSVLSKSVLGRAWVAMRESETLAKTVGVNSFQYALVAYVTGAVISAGAGSLYAHYVGFVDPESFAFTWSSYAVVSVVLGGKGLVFGPVLGGLIMTMVPEYLRLASLWRLPIFGAVIIALVIFLPDGLLTLPRAVRAHRAKRRARGQELEVK